MISRRGWGLLLAVSVVLLVYFGWSLLQSQKSRLHLERYAGSTAAQMLLQPLVQHYLASRSLAMPGDVTLPEAPRAMGVKAWSVGNDSVVRVELDAKVDGQQVVLNYVPVVHTANAAFYDCVSSTAAFTLASSACPKWCDRWQASPRNCRPTRRPCLACRRW